ncbi:hypothetical protein OHU11_32690 [Streptomyces sp. NBC_00257]|uniref:hypothetical protein n=1 Tax=unclassified Streptomyces TaxID=2593676 RepID=UPI00225B3AB5|nr:MULTISPECIES: hypothetical protein [unclassified Streptomyces]WTB53655.1 hypothetical protein OG832_11000 [Streptomyces sp. NBC_00826]WTH93456.1 hypothetical protein OIC43_32685 [Streptomyces sp. NBC_00825]WTI02189.1 hypothetical protein OHA23_32665 [Streptomyces sp. NBC_00822]MCX4867809.1 hypothetical protein [Streptomyces sp. NBC_00906]MCX4899047.1 hypothetical protein [Streptomyces sp. NBC_00892]
MIPSTARTAHHSRTADHSRTARSAAASLAATGILTGAALLTVAAPGAAAATGPTAGPAALAAARHAATEPTTLDTLARFFAREGAVTRSAAAPRIEGAAVPVNTLDPDFVAGKPGAPVARLDYLATTAVSSDGQKASLWTLPKEGKDGGWQVVNIASGDDETRYAAEGTRRLPGGTVFREPQTDAWFVQKGTKVLPLDRDAVRAVGARGTTLAAYRARVRAAYGDKLPGSGYARSGKAGGYAPPAAAPAPEPRTAAASTASGTALTATSAAAGAGALVVLALSGLTVLRNRRRRETP